MHLLALLRPLSSKPRNIFEMRSFPAILSAVVLAISGARLVQGLPAPEINGTMLQERASGAAGFLSATFLGDVPHVYLHYSKASAPVTFSAVSGSKGELVPTLGTKGARDPYIFQNRVNGKVSRAVAESESDGRKLMTCGYHCDSYSSTSWRRIWTSARLTGAMPSRTARVASTSGSRATV